MKSEDLRVLADWIDANPDSPLATEGAEIDTYGVSAEQGRKLIAQGFPLDMLNPTDTIVYIMQVFGGVTVRNVVRKSKLCQPCVVNGEIAWELKPEADHA